MRVAADHAVEEKGINIVVERFVIEEELAEQTEIAAPAALTPAVDLEERAMVVAVDFVAGGVQQRAFGAVPLERPQAVGVAEAELADVGDFGVRVRGRVRGKVPRFDLEGTHLDVPQVAHARHFGLVLCHTATGPKLFNLLLARAGAGLGWVGRFGDSGGVLDVDKVEV